MAVNFAELLDQDVSSIKEPEPTPPGNYTFMVGDMTTGESSQKGTPYVQFECSITAPSDDVDLSNTEGGFEAIAGRKMRISFYLTEGALFRLRNFIDACGIDTEKGGSLGDLLPQVQGASFLGTVTQKPSPRDPSRTYAELTDFAKL